MPQLLDLWLFGVNCAAHTAATPPQHNFLRHLVIFFPYLLLRDIPPENRVSC
ncbi:hypothetical protein Pecwa_2946 [Pectobacterium parmentieri WPP163]|nr:hypothetical protein Pecwa_2946 [Pectobacterium parmentieri WPP163]